MKCLSLWQPWATLYVIGAKRFETRSWATKHRGPLAIHAAKRWTPDQRALCLNPRFRKYLHTDQTRPMPRLPLGAIIGVVDLAGCHQFWYGGAGVPAPDTDEFHFGDYTPGRFGWCAENPRQLAKPIPYRGRQGLFEIDDALVADALASGGAS